MNERTIRLGNRMSGLAMMVFGGVIGLGGNEFFSIGGTIYFAEGLGDALRGTHHYVSTRIIKYLSRGKIDIEYN